MLNAIPDLSMAIVFLVVAGTTLVRYVLFAGLAYLVLWVILRRRLDHRHIQQTFPPASHVWREIGYSLSSVLIFAGVGAAIHYAYRSGWTLIYRDFSDFGAGYAVFSFALLVILHDAYFYWAHRLMHHPRLFRYLHNVHHKSLNPSPWAALFFQPSEAILEAGIMPIAVLLFPLHIYTILVFFIWMMFLNTLGHAGFELYPKGFTRSRWTWWNNTSTHHNLHHRFFHCNYGLYFNWWDRLMGTNHPQYHEIFDRITTEPLLTGPSEPRIS